MRVVIMSVGTNGDVYPFTGLAARAKEAGHDVTFATTEPFRSAVEESGIGFHPVDADVRELLRTAPRINRKRIRWGPSSGRALFEAAQNYTTIMVNAFDSMLVAAEHADVLLVASGVSWQGYLIGKALNTPTMGLAMMPMTPTREFSPALYGGRSFGPLLNRLAGPAHRHAVTRS
ncbi:glycosyltransferase [Kibdelosporangium lantanae]|uniref:Glycosyltransferase n=1 Tax=Kibdelosporangium lantanae TaxID=1497396 RepID=A0ABW3M9J2_9PSEU